MTHLDLCTGIGGFHIAAVWAGFKTIGFSETDSYCSELLTQHWPEIPNYGDIRTADFSACRGCTVLSAGVPCRPVLPGSAEALRMTVGSGRQCSMWLEQSSPLGAFSKILLASSRWANSMEYCYVWNRLDTRFGLSAFQLTRLGLNTSDTESSLLGTPDASHALGPNGQESSLKNTLDRMALWRTPTRQIGERGAMDGEKRLENGHCMSIQDQVANPRLWPTPTVPNGGRRNPEGTSITGRKPDGGKAQMDLREYAIRTQECSGSLNPRFVEQLMGFPIDHTVLKRSATRSCRTRRTRSSKP